MAHFLIVDDEDFIRQEWKTLLQKQNHTYVEAEDVDFAIDAINCSQENGEPFDLILLDHQLGDETGLDLLEFLDKSYFQNRVIVITGHATISLAREYALIGAAISHLIKPVSESQFHTAIESALERKKILVDEKENWESAYALLENLGILDSLEELEADVVELQNQYITLKYTYEKLLDDLKEAGGQEYEMAQAYERASQTLNQSTGNIRAIIPLLSKFQITASFWSDIEKLFARNRLYFFILQNYLQRISENPLAYRIKHLAGRANGHYEYRIGRDYRLYFRYTHDTIILERFGNKNIQDKILTFLKNNVEPIINLS